jgi:hypothetical protein
MADQEGTVTMNDLLERELALEEEAEAKLAENWGDEKYVVLTHHIMSLKHYISCYSQYFFSPIFLHACSSAPFTVPFIFLKIQ